MIKLKIGQNYLLANYGCQSSIIDKDIIYMMSNFQGRNKIALAFIPDSFSPKEINKILTESNCNELFLLVYNNLPKNRKNIDKLSMRRYIYDLKNYIHNAVCQLNSINTLLKIKVINVNAYESTNEFRLSKIIYEALKKDPKSVASSLNELDLYKTISKRYSSIPNEIKIIDNDIKRLGKITKICDRIPSLEAISYLNLIDKAEITEKGLELTIKELTVNLSEPLGKVYRREYFENNRYLYKTAEYIYRGCHFKVPKTKIYIDYNFNPHFIESLDKRFDYMLSYHNWSGIGYPHFGSKGFCPGEFNDAMAHGKEYGLEYYFIALKQYLTTANMRDLAGVKIWWYPIYNDKEELVYCAGFDILIEEYIKHNDQQLYLQLKDKSMAEKINILCHTSFNDRNLSKFTSSNLDYHYSGKTDAFLDTLQDRDKELYNEIIKNINTEKGMN